MKSLKEIKKAIWNRDLDRPISYQPLNEHPEFSDWEALQPCVERWKMICGVLPLEPPGKVLDLGCHTGWFCRKFSQHGWTALGIDRDPMAIEIASELMRSWNGDPPPSYQLEDLSDTSLPLVDVALCLSLAMYIFPQPGWELLDQISYAAPIMFFDYGGMYSHNVPLLPETAGEQIVEHTQYTSYRKLGHTNFESRPFFIFERI